jgi:DNA-binding transcriptional ArsR family regulator
MVYYLSTDGSSTDVFGALSDQTRLAIVQHLAGTDATINELAEPFGMTLQAVSKHIRVLEKAGLVRRQKIGRSYHCKLNSSALSTASDTLSRIEAEWRARLDRLGTYLEQNNNEN